MANTLYHSPADVIRWLLIGLGECTDPTLPTLAAWPVYVNVEPDAPDAVVTIVDTYGTDRPRDMFGGMHVANGFQVLVRCPDQVAGRRKADAIRLALAPIDKRTVAIGSSRYTVNAIPAIGQVLVLGFESPTSKRLKFSVNAQVSLTQAA